MRSTLLRYIAVPLLAIYIAGNAHGQEILDTLAPQTGLHTVKISELYFDALKAKQHNDIRRATELFEQLTQLDPGNASAYYELSVLYDEERKTEKALINLKKATALVKDNKWYNMSYAALLARQGNFVDAAEVVANIADKETSDAEYAAQAADYYERAKKYDKAVKYLDKAIAITGTDEELLVQKMTLYLHMQEIAKAEEIGKQLIARDPRSGKYYKLLADVYENYKMPEKVLQLYIDANKAAPGEPIIEWGLADNYRKKGDTVNFYKYARQAISNPGLDNTSQIQFFYLYIQGLPERDQAKEGAALLPMLLAQHPSDAILLSTYGDFLATDMQLDKAIEQYKLSLAIKPSEYDVWNRLLTAYAFQSATDSLIKYSEKVMRLFPNQAMVHYYNALGHYNKKEYPVAIKALLRAADMVPEGDTKKLSEVHSMLGEVYNTTKQYKESDDAFDQALKNDPQNASVLNNYAYFLSERGAKLSLAKEMSERSLKIRPSEMTFLDTYGWILYKMGDYEKARENIEKAAEGRKADGTIYDHLGDVYYKLKNKTKALENWRLAKEKGATNPVLDKKISEQNLYE